MMEMRREYRWETTKVFPGTDLAYRVRLQDHLLKDEAGAVRASLFGFSYIRVPEDKNRPVVFAYNGGPGAASGWLHMGLLGPKIVCFPGYPEVARPAEYRLENNQEFLLDVCDLVLIDPPGTAYARVFDKDAESRYFSTQGDAAAFADFVCAWLRENGRTGAPVYLLGESYGTIRNVVLADLLPEDVDLRGIISIGTSLNVGARGTLLVEPNVRRLGANAACCWYHQEKELSQKDFVRQAIGFAYSGYARALLLGKRLPEAEREKVLEQLHTFCGLDRTLLEKQKLRFSEQDFVRRLCPGEVVSTYDSRLTYRSEAHEEYAGTSVESTEIEEPDLDQDAFMNTIGPAFRSALSVYFQEELQVPPDREYLPDQLEISDHWDYRTCEKDTLALPAELMQTRPRLRMLFVNGCYDLSSTFDFMIYYLSQYDLPADRVERLVLPSGHASYVGEGMAAELSRSIRAFLQGRSVESSCI